MLFAQVSGSAPPPRAYHSATYVGGAGGNIAIFGGFNGKTSTTTSSGKKRATRLADVYLLATLPFEIIGLMYHGKLDLGFKLLRLLRLTKVIRQLDVHNNVRPPARRPPALIASGVRARVCVCVCVCVVRHE